MIQYLLTKSIIVVLIFFLSISYCKGQRLIFGSIKTKDNEPLIGSSILIEGTSIGTISDLDGSFKLMVPDSASSLEIRFIGFITKRIDITADTTYEITLREDCVKCWFDSQKLSFQLNYDNVRNRIGYTASITSPVIFGNTVLRFDIFSTFSREEKLFYTVDLSALHLFASCDFDLNYHTKISNIVLESKRFQTVRNLVDLNFRGFYPIVGAGYKKINFDDRIDRYYGFLVGYRHYVGRPFYIDTSTSTTIYNGDIEVEIIIKRRIKSLELILTGYKIENALSLRIGFKWDINYFLPNQRNSFNHYSKELFR